MLCKANKLRYIYTIRGTPRDIAIKERKINNIYFEMLFIVVCHCHRKHLLCWMVYLSVYLSILSRSFFDHHLRCGGSLNLDLSKRVKIFGMGIKLFTRSRSETCLNIHPWTNNQNESLRFLSGLGKDHRRRGDRSWENILRHHYKQVYCES